MARRRYVLTAKAAADLREARVWSQARWGKELTRRYFQDLHEGVQHIAENHGMFRARHELAGGGSALHVYPVREHYIVYEPLRDRFIAVVAVIRQGRDVPAILQKWAAPIRRELLEIRAGIADGSITAPETGRSAVKARAKK